MENITNDRCQVVQHRVILDSKKVMLDSAAPCPTYFFFVQYNSMLDSLPSIICIMSCFVRTYYKNNKYFPSIQYHVIVFQSTEVWTTINPGRSMVLHQHLCCQFSCKYHDISSSLGNALSWKSLLRLMILFCNGWIPDDIWFHLSWFQKFVCLKEMKLGLLGVEWVLLLVDWSVHIPLWEVTWNC